MESYPDTFTTFFHQNPDITRITVKAPLQIIALQIIA